MRVLAIVILVIGRRAIALRDAEGRGLSGLDSSIGLEWCRSTTPAARPPRSPCRGPVARCRKKPPPHRDCVTSAQRKRPSVTTLISTAGAGDIRTGFYRIGVYTTGPMASTQTQWQMRGTGYEFCNCDFGCGCNFGGFPELERRQLSRAGRDAHRVSGVCGDVTLDGVKCAALVKWPKAIHEGNGKCVFVVDPATTDKQIDVLAQIFSRQARRAAVGAARPDLGGRRPREGEDHHRRRAA